MDTCNYTKDKHTQANILCNTYPSVEAVTIATFPDNLEFKFWLVENFSTPVVMFTVAFEFLPVIPDNMQNLLRLMYDTVNKLSLVY